MRFYGLMPVWFVRALRATSGATVTTLLVCGPAAPAPPPDTRSPHVEQRPSARTAMEAAFRNEGLEWRLALSTSEGLEFFAQDGNDLYWILCAADSQGPRVQGENERRLSTVADGQTWKAVFNSSTGRLYRIFGFRQTDLQNLLGDAVGNVPGELQAFLIAKFHVLHAYAEETEILLSEWSAYAFTFGHIGRDGSERDEAGRRRSRRHRRSGGRCTVRFPTEGFEIKSRRHG